MSYSIRSLMKLLCIAGASMLACGTVYAQATDCTYYVSPSGTDLNDTQLQTQQGSKGTTQASAFATPQNVTYYLYNIWGSTHTAPSKTVICILGGTYRASDYAQANKSTNSATGSAKATLLINLSGTAANPVIYKNYDSTAVNLIVTGYGGIVINGPANYITITGMTVTGLPLGVDSAAASNTARYNNLNTNGTPKGYPYYDGGCIFIQGDPVTNSPSNTPARGSFGNTVPTHITISYNYVANCGGGGIASKYADYVTFTGNTVHDTALYSIYGASGMSMLTLVNSDTNTSNATTKNFLTNNYSYNNQETVNWYQAPGAPAITDGEGIIIDTNRNGLVQGTSVTIPAYLGRTLVANNVVWNNGGPGIEVFQSDHVDIQGNSTYKNGITPGLTGEGDAYFNRATDVYVANSNFYGKTKPVGSGGSQSSEPANSVQFDNNIRYAGGAAVASYSSVNATFTDRFGNNTGDPQYATPVPSPVYNRADLSVGATSLAATNGCVSSGVVCNAPAKDVLGVTRPGSGYPSGAYVNTH